MAQPMSTRDEPMADKLEPRDAAALHTFENAKTDMRAKDDNAAIQQMRALVETQPLYFPPFLALAVVLQRQDARLTEEDALVDLKLAGKMLRHAVRVSNRNPEALLELACFVDAVEDNAQVAKPLFAEALSKLTILASQAAYGLKRSTEETTDSPSPELAALVQLLQRAEMDTQAAASTLP
jgi:hypothetical protein